MSTLIFGITLDELGAAIILLPLGGALINLLIWTLWTSKNYTWIQPLVKTLGIAVPFLCLVLLVLMYSMLGESTTSMVLGPYVDWFNVTGVIFDIALWLDPLSLLWSCFVLGLGLVVAWYCIIGDNGRENLALLSARHQFFMFFILLLLWADSMPLFYLAWEGLALTAYWFWSSTPGAGQDRKVVFWMTRSVNILFLLGILWALQQISTVDETNRAVRLTFALLEEYRRFFSGALLYIWMVPAIAYAAQWPLSFWQLRSQKLAYADLCWFYGFGLGSAGLYFLTRLNVLILSQETVWYWLELIGALTALFAACAALRQQRLRGIVAAALVSQYGLIVCAFGTGNFATAMLHWLFVSIAAALLSLGAGLVARQSGSDSIAELGGLLKRLPGTALCTLIACATLIGLAPMATFVSQYRLLWSFATENRLGALAATSLSSILLAIALTRWWAATFLGPCRQRSLSQNSAVQRGAVIAPIALALLLIGTSWMALPEIYRGPEILQTWLLPVFEDHLPIRSERFTMATQIKFALVCWVTWYVLALIVALLYARKRSWLKNQNEYWAWWNAIESAFNRITQRLAQSIKQIRDLVIRQVCYEGMEKKIIGGLLLSGTASAFTVMSRGLSRIQTGRVGHYIILLFMGVALFIAFLIR